MINHGNVQSTVKPESVEVTDTHVWIAEDIETVNTDDFEGFSYNLTQYELKEYTLGLIEKSKADIDYLAVMTGVEL